MASSSAALAKLACALFMCMLVAAPHAQAVVTCNTVSTNVGPCIAYLIGRVNAPSRQCCNGIRTLRNMASTPADRRNACNCLKSAATRMNNMNFGRAAGLPRRCGVTIAYAINPRTDCSRVR